MINIRSSTALFTIFLSFILFVQTSLACGNSFLGHQELTIREAPFEIRTASEEQIAQYRLEYPENRHWLVLSNDSTKSIILDSVGASIEPKVVKKIEKLWLVYSIVRRPFQIQADDNDPIPGVTFPSIFQTVEMKPSSKILFFINREVVKCGLIIVLPFRYKVEDTNSNGPFHYLAYDSKQFEECN